MATQATEGHIKNVNKNRKRFFEKKHSCGFVLQNQPMYIPIF